uniref:Transcription factor S-II (TFIIS) n=1 Tax=Siphoviridae sp. ct6Ob18 TaxID=2827783 RepID=A0A8S5TIE8_9CAUD|nr:MAG TPA: Transcription factor S-II (TFIIS) [Siphoviridae sp. ct6Ob18]DAQ50680.1 MAG TPA: Transcription factor S-II (TFIIS) [Caudoviricetes sp.]DAU64681.1 MAG TPA: Transcription factor S-II (TFIIS) [Caudoviricetes sp.]
MECPGCESRALSFLPSYPPHNQRCVIVIMMLR